MAITEQDIQDLEKFAKEFDLPNDIKLNQASTIRDTKKFFDSHIIILRGGTSDRIKQLHYDRLIAVIKIIESEGLLVVKSGTYSETVPIVKPDESVEPVEVVENDNELDMPESFETEDAMKPNDDFESEAKPIKPNTGFDSEQSPKIERVIPEPQKIQEKEVSKKKDKSEPSQTSLF